MIVCKPKTSTYLALGLIVIILISGLIYTLHHFANVRSFSLIFYLFSTVLLTLVILLLLVKMMASYKFIAAGKSQIITRLPLRGKIISYGLDQVLVWEEEKVTTNKREFKQTTIVFDDKSSFTLSNHEHVNYEAFVVYLQKKLLQKRVDKIKKNQ
jgi:hypothetical protein